MSIDTVGDFLTIIRNGLMVSKPSVQVPFSKLKHQIALLLKEEGFIRDVVVEDRHMNVLLKYVGGESVIHEINRISTPGKRLYKGGKSIKPVIGGLGISIVTTSKGIITDKKAKALNVGGEVICTVW
jgi:small subunit ribosomal protein S8